MGKILGIDYGRRHVGFALASGPLAEPLEVYAYYKHDELILKIRQLIASLGIETVVLGIPDGPIREDVEALGKSLGKFGVKVVYHDETLSSKDAQALAIEAGKKRKKRKRMEHAFAATLVLQSYIDAHKA